MGEKYSQCQNHSRKTFPCSLHFYNLEMVFPKFTKGPSEGWWEPQHWRYFVLNGLPCSPISFQQMAIRMNQAGSLIKQPTWLVLLSKQAAVNSNRLVRHEAASLRMLSQREWVLDDSVFVCLNSKLNDTLELSSC